MDWLLEYFYTEGDLLKTFLSVFAFMFVFLILLEVMYILRSGMRNLM